MRWPLTNEILPYAFANADEIEREGFVDLAARFIVDVFGIDSRLVAVADPDRIPSLTLLLSIIDIALDRREAWVGNAAGTTRKRPSSIRLHHFRRA